MSSFLSSAATDTPSSSSTTPATSAFGSSPPDDGGLKRRRVLSDNTYNKGLPHSRQIVDSTSSSTGAVVELRSQEVGGDAGVATTGKVGAQLADGVTKEDHDAVVAEVFALRATLATRDVDTAKLQLSHGKLEKVNREQAESMKTIFKDSLAKDTKIEELERGMERLQVQRAEDQALLKANKEQLAKADAEIVQKDRQISWMQKNTKELNGKATQLLVAETANKELARQLEAVTKRDKESAAREAEKDAKISGMLGLLRQGSVEAKLRFDFEGVDILHKSFQRHLIEYARGQGLGQLYVWDESVKSARQIAHELSDVYIDVMSQQTLTPGFIPKGRKAVFYHYVRHLHFDNPPQARGKRALLHGVVDGMDWLKQITSPGRTNKDDRNRYAHQTGDINREIFEGYTWLSRVSPQEMPHLADLLEWNTLVNKDGMDAMGTTSRPALDRVPAGGLRPYVYALVRLWRTNTLW
ncbi:hypothetical protein MNV49_006605 [Pseudohyphozyma bogoriensis]|nr:hypothetical protein MNV49_006605 [Pseudohyphozyma bogoriensis]